MEDTKDNLILVLADMFLTRHTDSKIVTDALKLICGTFSFDCGLIYDIDQYNCFDLKERFFMKKIYFREHFSTDEIEPDTCEAMTNTLLYTTNKDIQTEETRIFFRLFSAESLTIFSIIDDRNKIHGLIILLNLSKKEFSSEQSHTLSAALSMFSRYLGIRMYQNKLSFAQQTMESILDNTGIDIYVNDFLTHEILYVNKSMAAPYGGIPNLLGHKCWKALFPGQNGPCEFCPQKKLIDEEGNPSKVYTWDYQRPFDGSWFRVFSSAFQWIDGRLAHVVSSADITDNKRNEELVQYLANYDSLTNLPNRRMLVAECERRITNTPESEKGYVLFFDIDGFKSINDTLGHDAGDEFLVKLGKFFSDIPLLKDAIYRNGGDEFVAVLDGFITEDNIRSLVGFIHERFKKPWILKNGTIYSNASIGVACYPSDGLTAEALLSKADQAMYKVKKAGGASVCFGYEMS